jgi:hypothetical protein
MMLTPQFTLRRLLLIVTVFAVLSLVPTVAARGYLWAVCLAMAILGAFVLAAISAVGFLITRALAAVVERSDAAKMPMNRG